MMSRAGLIKNLESMPSLAEVCRVLINAVTVCSLMFYLTRWDRKYTRETFGSCRRMCQLGPDSWRRTFGVHCEYYKKQVSMRNQPPRTSSYLRVLKGSIFACECCIHRMGCCLDLTYSIRLAECCTHMLLANKQINHA
jgi:hypothetical protein